MLRVWGRRDAFNVQKVMWLIGELGLEHEHVDAGGRFGGLEHPTFLAMNPHGRVPVIDDAGTIVWESHAIIRYLCARYAIGTLWPEEPASRSLADRWMDWTLATLQRDFMELFWGFYRTPAAERDWALIEDRLKRCACHYQLLDRHLAGSPHLAGQHFTMADLPAGTTLYRYFALEIDRPEVRNVRAWYDRLAERAAYRSHVMRPFADLCGRLAY